MKISEMIKGLEEIMTEHGDLDCWYVKDDEGNGYHRVHYRPSMCWVDSDDEMYGDEGDIAYCGLTLSDVTPVCVVN